VNHGFLKLVSLKAGSGWVESASVFLIVLLCGADDRLPRRSFPRWCGRLRINPIAVAVVTDQEKILAQLDAFVAGVEAEDRAAIGQVIDEKYDAEGMDRDGVLEFLTDSLKSVDIFDTRLRRRDVTVDGDHADLDLGAMATVRIRAGAGDIHQGRWRLRWRRTDEWRIVSLMPVEIDTIKFSTLQQSAGDSIKRHGGPGCLFRARLFSARVCENNPNAKAVRIHGPEDSRL
jgi:hypothetical protein